MGKPGASVKTDKNKKANSKKNSKSDTKSNSKAISKAKSKAATKEVKKVSAKPIVVKSAEKKITHSIAKPSSEIKSNPQILNKNSINVEQSSKAKKNLVGAPKIKLDKAGMTEEQLKWAEYYEKNQKEPAQSYNMKESFEPNKPILHDLLGWGFILSIENDRLEVLFETGKKILISNYSSAR